MKTPSHLNALRAFEATARLGSFKAAAEEIGVTPEAVGQLVRTLEAYLGLPLFHRSRGGKRLTPSHEALSVLPAVSKAFRSLLNSTEQLKRLSKSGMLTLTAPPSITAQWLIPLLPKFLQEQPEIDVRLDITERVLDLNAGDADVAIRYGDGRWPDVQTIELIHNEQLIPVCAPELYQRYPQGFDLDVLLQQTLIHDATMDHTDFPRWQDWLKHVGCTQHGNLKFIELNASLSVIEMAKTGQGVALAREQLVLSDVAQGRLIRLFPEHALSSLRNYYIVTPKQTSPAAKALANWLQEQLTQQ